MGSDFSCDKGRGVRKIVLAGSASAILYLVLHLSQRGIFLEGFHHSIAAANKLGDSGIRATLPMQIIGYYAAIVGLFAAYFWVIKLCQRGDLDNRQVRNLALFIPVLINLGFLLVRPNLSIDLYTYIAQGYLGTIPGQNPYSVEAKSVFDTPLGLQLVEYGWRPVHGISPYGALWTQLEIAIIRMTGNISIAILVIKALVVTASLTSAVIIWKILGRICPTAQFLGTLVYLWNPLITVEFAAEGHNDALMIMFVLAAVLFCVARRPVLSIIAILLGVFTKYLPLIFMPAQALFLWRGWRNWKRFAFEMTLGLAIGIGIALLLYSPLWLGVNTFNGVFLNARLSSPTSPAGILSWLLKQLISKEKAGQISGGIIGVLYAILVLALSFSLRDKSRLRELFAYIALSYVLIAASIYWPWYACLPFALLALSPSGISLTMALVLSFSSRLAAPLDALGQTGILSYKVVYRMQSTLGMTLPLMIFMVLLWRGRRKVLPACDLPPLNVPPLE